MRIDITGNNFDHRGSSHKITHGFHDHDEAYRKTGQIRSVVQNTSVPEQINSESGGEGLGFWQTLITGVKNMWGHIWGSSIGGENELGADSGETVGAKQTMAQVGAADVAESHGPAIAAAANATQASMAVENPYFTTASDKHATQEDFMQRVRIRFRELTNQLKKSFSGRFGGRMAGEYSGRGALNSGQQKSKEDLRKHSRYREDGLEIDCVLTDDSYLMDSYDRSGAYSKLTTEHKK